MESLGKIIRHTQIPRPKEQQARLPRPSAEAGQPGTHSPRSLSGQLHPAAQERHTGRLDGQPRPTGYSAARAPQQLPRASANPDERWETQRRSPLHQMNRTGSYNAAPQPPQRMPTPARYVEPQANYYEEDEGSTVISSDVQEGWTDESAAMLYGDWEDAPGYAYPEDYAQEEPYTAPARVVRETNPGSLRPLAQPPQQVPPRLARVRDQQSPLATREFSRAQPDFPRVPVTRDLRDSLALSAGPDREPHPLRGGRDPRDLRPRHPEPEQHPARQPHEGRETRLPVPSQQARQQLAPPPGQRVTQPLRPQESARLRELQRIRQGQQAQSSLPATPRDPADITITVPSAPAICPICRGAGFLRANVPYGDPQFGKAIACQCKEQERKRKRRQQLQELSNLGDFAGKRFSTFNSRIPGMQEAFELASAYAQAPEGWLLFIGPNGCGKTHLAAAIANECLEAGAVVLFATVPDLLDHLRAAFAPESKEVFDQLFSRMREAEVLILDDLGAQQSSPWATEKLFQLLNYRYNAGFPTVITANPRGLQSTDERIRSRLSDISLVATINLDRARDYRPSNPRRD